MGDDECGAGVVDGVVSVIGDRWVLMWCYWAVGGATRGKEGREDQM